MYSGEGDSFVATFARAWVRWPVRWSCSGHRWRRSDCASWLLRLRARLPKAHGDGAAYAHVRDHYRDMAKTLGFEGHMKWTEAMP
jgi:hypothetical protein